MLGKLENGQLKIAGGKIIRFGDEITVNPRDEDFIRIGYKPVEDNRLEEKEGFYQVPDYSETEEKIIVNYHYEEIPDEPETAT